MSGIFAYNRNNCVAIDNLETNIRKTKKKCNWSLTDKGLIKERIFVNYLN